MLYLLHGPNDFARNEKIAEIRAAIGDPMVADLNITSLDGRDLKLGGIRNYADAMPFMADKRVVIVQGYLSQLKSDTDELKQVIDYLKHLPASTDLVLVETETLPKNHPVLKAAIDLEATIINYGAIDRDSLRPWITQRVKALNAAIEPDAVELLARLVGSEPRTLISEIEKLTLYVGGERSIRLEDVELLVPYTEEAENFGLTNAIGQRNARRAYDQLRKQLDEGKHPMSLLASIAAQVRGLLEVKDMAERRLSPQEIAKAKGWRSDYAAKMRLKEAANFSMARLEEILEMLLEMDLAIKTGRIDSMLALDMLVARLCKPGQG